MQTVEAVVQDAARHREGQMAEARAMDTRNAAAIRCAPYAGLLVSAYTAHGHVPWQHSLRTTNALQRLCICTVDSTVGPRPHGANSCRAQRRKPSLVSRPQGNGKVTITEVLSDDEDDLKDGPTVTGLKTQVGHILGIVQTIEQTAQRVADEGKLRVAVLSDAFRCAHALLPLADAAHHSLICT